MLFTACNNDVCGVTRTEIHKIHGEFSLVVRTVARPVCTGYRLVQCTCHDGPCRQTLVWALYSQHDTILIFGRITE